MRKVFSAVFLMCMVALLFPLPASTHITTHIPVSGVFDYTFTIIYDRVIGDKILIFATEDELWQGSFSGTAEAVFIVIIFPQIFGRYSFEPPLPVRWMANVVLWLFT